MTRKTTSTGTFGKGLKNLKKKEAAEWRARNAVPFEVHVGSTGSKSVLEQTNLQDLIATVEMRKEEYAEEWGEADLVEGPVLITTDDIVQAEDAAAHERDLVSIPRRPKWQEGMTTEELAVLEHEAFVNWRRELADIAATHRLHLTPFERNLDFWRQLWRCMERSDLLVEIVDARDPDFYQCRDLPHYMTELGGDKKHMLLINKADFLSRDLRRQWADHFAQRGVSVVFFSALLEVQSQAKRADGKDQAPLKARVAEAYEQPEEDTEQQQQPQTVTTGQWQRWAALSEETGAAEAAEDTDAVAVPVPGLDDSDDDLADDPAARPNASEDGDEVESADEEDEGEDEAAGVVPCGQVDDDDDIVVDAAGLIEELLQRVPISDADSGRRGTIGFVGYPNVGKSTVINALVGSKRVGMSSTPGKTKHIQTLEVPSLGITFCDCPGLVFPSVAATRAHLVINNTVPLDDLRECWTSIALIVDKVGLPRLLDQYKCKQYVVDAAKRSGDHRLDDSHSFLAAFAVARHHFLRAGVPDENWAARKVLRDYVSGALLHCELPRRQQEEDGANEPLEACAAEATMGVQEELDIVDDDDFEAANMVGAPDAKARGIMTKKKTRHLQKQMNKGAPQTELPNSRGRTQARGQQLAWS